jgi:hypothetical protein
MYAQGDVRYEELCSEANRNTTSFGRFVVPRTTANPTDSEEGSAEVDIEDADNLADGTQDGEKAKATAKALQCLMWGRQIALNPYLFKCSGFKQEPTARMYVEQSPKLLYTMECIKSIKQYHENSEDSPFMSGQVIYMNFGTKAFELLRDYLVEVLGFTMEEIGIIRGDGNYIGKKRFDNKQRVADAFLGRVLDPETGKYTQLDESKRVKVLIGSESIKEGINLQEYASVLYNCFLDFNPTDMVQVEGRIWRQGNSFANVRIVTPLMADCIDIFMFQKLEDKTERINQIWTKNGNSNELDTTAFNPAELKYELLTDPIAIAKLEKEYKKEKLEEQKTLEGEILSGYLAIESIFKKSLDIKYQPINAEIKEDFRFRMHYHISQVRPDLIDKPLVNQEGYESYIKAVYEENKERFNSGGIESAERFLNEAKNIYEFIFKRYDKSLSYSSPLRVTEPQISNPLYRMYLDKLFNYSVEDLINLMVQVLKDQKIAYPLGYSKNWRELIPKKPSPIVEGDEIEFDTLKKGRVKGVAENVRNSSGVNILSRFWDKDIRFNFINDDEIIETIKKSGVNPKNFDVNDPKEIATMEFDELPKDVQNDLRTLLKWMYENDTYGYVIYDNGEIDPQLIPAVLDSDEYEDLSVSNRNIKKIEKEVKEKKVQPTKYPEPFVWSNKDRNENIKDISEYIGFVLMPKKSENPKLSNYEDYVIEYADMQPTEMIPQGSDEIYSLPQIVSVNSSTWNALTFKTQTFDNLKDAWAMLIEAWKDADRGGMFKSYYRKFYSTDMPMTLAEFKTIEEKKMKPLGINNFQDVENLINGQKTKINTLALEQRNLDDEQVFEELVQEVVRRIEALNSEEIRLGSSISARVASFANPNSDYLGNNMLSLFVAKDEEQEKAVKKKVAKQVEKLQAEVVEEVVVEETTDGDLKEQTKEFIAQLKPALKFYKGAEKKEFKEYIASMEAFLTTFD